MGAEETQSPAWREDASVWEIVSGELYVRRDDRRPGGMPALLQECREMAERAATAAGAGDLSSAGHALIGCTVGLGLAALRSGAAAEQTSIEDFASELGSMVSWDAGARPSVGELSELSVLISSAAPHAQGAPRHFGPTLWELAVRAGNYAAGLSPHIVRRSERRDLAA